VLILPYGGWNTRFHPAFVSKRVEGKPPANQVQLVFAFINPESSVVLTFRLLYRKLASATHPLPWIINPCSSP